MPGCNRDNPCLCGGCEQRIRELERRLRLLADGLARCMEHRPDKIDYCDQLAIRSIADEHPAGSGYDQEG